MYEPYSGVTVEPVDEARPWAILGGTRMWHKGALYSRKLLCNPSLRWVEWVYKDMTAYVIVSTLVWWHGTASSHQVIL